VAEPAAASTPLDPPPPTQAVDTTLLPQCSDVGNSGSYRAQAVDLGWGPGKPHALINKGTYGVEIAPMIPCRNGNTRSSTLVVPVMNSVVYGSSTASALGQTQLVMQCWDGTNYISFQTDNNVNGVWGYPNLTGNGLGAGGQYVSPVGPAGSPSSVECPYLVSVSVDLESGYPQPDNLTTLKTTWKASQWLTSSGGWTPATGVNQFSGGSVELPISCPINNSGSDLFTVVQNVVGSLVQLPVCWFVPAGWDRAGRIADVWNSGPAGELADAFKAAVPSGLVCGPVATIPWQGTSVALDTCTADVASSTVKTVVGWVIVLGLAALIVRRLFWVVGSRA